MHELQPMNRRLSALLLGLGWLLMLINSARAEVRIFDLQHRSAPELVPIVSPLLGSDGGVSALDNRLIVRADPKTLSEIARLVVKLDTAPRQLLITVRQGSHDRQQDAAAPSAGQGSRLVAQTQGGGEDAQRHDLQQVQVLEGQRAIIQISERLPLPERLDFEGRRPAWSMRSLTYRSMSVGFEVIPHLQDDRFTLELAPHQDTFTQQGYRIQQRGISSRVTGRLGQWLEVGGTLGEQALQATGASQVVESRQDEAYRVWVKVDEMGRVPDKPAP